MNIRKNQYVDLLKGLSCIIVIFLHCPFPGVLGEGIIYGLRFSVPVFFMISGYYSYSKKDEWIISKAVYIFKLIVFTELFYGIWNCINICMIQGENIQRVYELWLAGKNIVEVIFCGCLFNGTLWYLYAMFWTWIIIYILRRTIKLKKCYVLIPILLMIQIVGRVYVQENYDINRWVMLFRNAITFGLPFCLLGTWIAENQKLLLEKISIKNNVFFIVGGFLLIVIEFMVYGKYMDTHWSTVIIAFGMFLYAVRQHKPVNNGLRYMLVVGSKWYVWIYLSHIFILDVVKILYTILVVESNMFFQFMCPVCVCVLSCFSAECIVRIKHKKQAVNS